MRKDPLELDDPETWPPLVLPLLQENLGLLKEHAAFEQHRYVLLGSGPTEGELAMRPNPFEEARNSLFGEIDQCCRDDNLLAYHCTRLTDDEVAAVREHGLRCLNDAAVAQRLAQRVAAGDLAPEDVERLLGRMRSCTAETPHERIGKIWAVPSPRALSDEDGLGNPLRYWGGEALLSLDGSDLGKLATLGTACIVEFEAPISKLVFASLPKDLVERFLHLYADGSDECGADVCVQGSVPANRVLNVFRRADDEFERLTDCSNWRVELT